MAEVVNEMPADFRGSTEKYPWGDWFDGRIWKLVRGVDFLTTSTDNFQARVYRKANDRGVKVRTVKHDDTLYVQAVVENNHAN